MTADSELASPGENRPADHKQGLSRASCLGLFVAVQVAVFVTLAAIWIMTSGQRLPNLTRHAFDAAWQKWQSQGLKDYSITTNVEGRQPAEYRVTVVDGHVTEATRNGQPLTQQRTLGTWSVPGMFDTIEYDVNTTEQESPPLKLELRADFDDRWGFPARYMRSDYTSKTTTRWEVIEFQPSKPPTSEAQSP